MPQTSPGLIAGTVVDAAGRPVPQARVYFVSSPVAMPDIAALTDDRGEFTLSVPADGAYEVGSVSEGFAPASTRVEVTLGQTARVTLRLQRA